MHFSHVHTRVANHRLSGLAVALILSLLLLGLLSGRAWAVTPTYCSTGTTQWQGGSGDWGSGSWSNGNPSAQCDTVINGNVTVTFTTQSDHYGNEDTANTDGLTLSGGATVVVQGESDGVIGNWYNATTLNVGADGLTINQGSTLDIEASNATQTPPAGTPPIGGSANVNVDSGASGPANVNNNGAIVASTNDSAWGESFNVGGTIANIGSVTDKSGLLTLQGQGNTAYLFNNSGTFTVDSGASVTMLAGDGSAFTNAGNVSNQGSFTLQGTMHWNQNAGSTSGNPIELTGGEVLVDAAGAGAFEVIDGCGGGALTGTVPQGQTVTVQGATQGCSGNLGQQSVMTLGTGSNPPPVVNHGTIVLNASGSGKTSGGSAQIQGAELDNYGTFDSTITDSNFTTTLSTPLVNEAGGTVNVTGGQLYQTGGTPTTNNGTVNVGPGSTWLVQGGSFTNSGRLGLQVAGATSFGNFNLT
ncbi:MAG TPA: hypothetical protein VHU61_01605, partial [Solirubrobacteraceae bacterium]|nr:hypothetical protein [Solirubrobacteraceae bacterium]